MSSDTLTGKTRYRTVHRGIWPIRWSHLVLQVEVQRRTELYSSHDAERPYRVINDFYWRDAKLQDLSVGERRELFCRENPR